LQCCKTAARLPARVIGYRKDTQDEAFQAFTASGAYEEADSLSFAQWLVFLPEIVSRCVLLTVFNLEQSNHAFQRDYCDTGYRRASPSSCFGCEW
jgi:hypothetical protein